jgi:glycosyltransferase involved in cell wall biosynthesis
MAVDDAHLRVALVVPPYFQVPPLAYGGIEAVVADLADALVDNGHSVTIVGSGPPGGTKARFEQVWDRLAPERLGQIYPELMNALLTRRAIAALAGKIDVVHDHTYSGPLNADTYARWGLPTVVTMHGPSSDPDLRSFYAALGDSIHMVAISERQRSLAPELNWVATVPNALHIDQWPFRDRKRDYALFLGRFSPDKGAHTALDAAHAAGRRLVLAGKCGEPAEKAYFDAEIKPRLLPDDVVFGVADAQEKRILLANARCLLFPVQWEEPFGMVMIEAMACGTPVVALRAGAVAEVVVDGVTGLICESPSGLAAAINAIESIDPVACRAHVAANFSARGLAEGYANAYRLSVGAMSAAHTPARRSGALARMVSSQKPDNGSVKATKATQ